MKRESIRKANLFAATLNGRIATTRYRFLSRITSHMEKIENIIREAEYIMSDRFQESFMEMELEDAFCDFVNITNEARATVYKEMHDYAVKRMKLLKSNSKRKETKNGKASM